ncbi:DNA-protecting protein DprA [Rhizorhabdus dicambivorans]|uniref:DNA-protecting protein DprA n=2 Tax=Rhizorhabdus dicambivorans TaxID=1850238 RepID=A0A2A4FXS9_9SPHN|nr:DNA-processing protein DprA [Rhizorhabdus dicambivorans]ATE67535.1 DNA-protecting protein DprA [Rhizorhabdus dicambivorans]PCE42280.1 DNA-protecting protein DprA [Rhizorhabdus dicambivorans]
MRRFGSGAAALAALPDLARRGGGAAPAIPSAESAGSEMARVERLGGAHLFRGEPGYPALLDQIDTAPPVLTLMGDRTLLDRPAIAIVGARNASGAAVRFARMLAHGLSERGWLVVSGLARGIDTAAHVGSIASGTMAVIAGGLDNIYPPENEALQRDIATRGLLIAESPPGTEPRARHFPYRNRIIAGLAAGTVVVEAAPKSGSLITARLAAEFGREVMAVPGSPLDPRAQGCNLLIREGAILIQSADDIIEALSPIGGGVASPRGDGPPQAPPAGEADDSARGAILDLLGPVPLPIDELIRQSGIAAPTVQMVLLEFELAGRIERHAGGRVSLRT